MEQFISVQTDETLKIAYSEMLTGCIQHPDQWEWYAIWMISLENGAHVGELCFKGLDNDGTAEIGYGIAQEYQRHGYASEAVNAAIHWAFKQPGVSHITAETMPENMASIRVLEKCGFKKTGTLGKEGLLYICSKDEI